MINYIYNIVTDRSVMLASGCNDSSVIWVVLILTALLKMYGTLIVTVHMRMYRNMVKTEDH